MVIAWLPAVPGHFFPALIRKLRHPTFGKGRRECCKRRPWRELAHRDPFARSVLSRQINRHGRIEHRPPALCNILGLLSLKGEIAVLVVMRQFPAQAGKGFGKVGSDEQQGKVPVLRQPRSEHD